jgi:hypothetical protein
VPPVASRSSWIEHPRAVGERVGVHLERVDAVLEDVLARDDLGRQLAGLRAARSPAPELARDRGAEDEAARLRGDDEVDSARRGPAAIPAPRRRPRAGRAAAA